MTDHPLHAIARNLPKSPGVYLFKNEAGEVIYVGKANVIRSRVLQYFQEDRLSKKTKELMAHALQLDFFTTNSACDALILENQLIKSYRPKYNIALKDGKTYPYLAISNDPYPRLSLYRGKRVKGVEYFGPYPNVRSAREAMVMLQKIFQIRDCRNSMFAHRTQPCMQYQIKRCSAPCVAKIAVDEYADSVQQVKKFLRGQSKSVLVELEKKMQSASDAMAFERAAVFRDAIVHIQAILQERQSIEQLGDYDIWCMGESVDQMLVQYMMIRDGKLIHIDHQQFSRSEIEDEELITWVFQSYVNRLDEEKVTVWLDPQLPLVSELGQAILQKNKSLLLLPAKKTASIKVWLDLGRQQLERMMPFLGTMQKDCERGLRYLCELLAVSHHHELLLECYDISHLGGEFTVGSQVVLSNTGLRSDLYRTYKVQAQTAGDDYAAIKEVLTRRAAKLKDQKVIWLIDGGKGQLSVARQVMAEHDNVIGAFGISKGPSRKFANEKYYLQKAGVEQAELIELDLKTRQLIGHLRDEAHRVAITASRKGHKKSVIRSKLDDIPGVGPVIKRRLKLQFGSVKNIAKASVEQLASVAGVGDDLARKIHHELNQLD